MHSVIQRVARIARSEAEFAFGFVRIEVPIVFGHLDFVGLHGRSEVPLAEEGIDHVRAGDGEL